MSTPLVLRGIVKAYGGVPALRGVDLDVRAGEIHALVGENGAGKSTLMKVLGGATRADAGSVEVDGRAAAIAGPADAQRLGIAIVHQEIRLVPELTVAQNVLLGREPLRAGAAWRPPLRLVDRAAEERVARAALAQLGAAELDPGSRVADLPMAARQLVEIARALARSARILALDEPTAALATAECERLFDVLRRLRAAGVALIYISHRLDEVLRLADRVTVLRDGAVVHAGPAAGLARRDLIGRMVGRDLEQEVPWRPRARGPELLRVEGLRARGLRGVDLALARGEVLGLGGLVGSGRSELAHVLFGASPREAGRVLLDGREVAPRSPREAIDLGIALLTEDRNRLGLIAGLNVRENVTLPSLAAFVAGRALRLLRRRSEAAAVRGLAERLRLKPPSTETPVAHLSGGNRQKVVLARWLLSRARLFLFDEPTAGVDVGAKVEIYELIAALAEGGAGILVISSDLPELLGICDRVAVMNEGRIAGELARGEATEARVLALAVPQARPA